MNDVMADLDSLTELGYTCCLKCVDLGKSRELVEWSQYTPHRKLTWR
jgi:hypothetical protein